MPLWQNLRWPGGSASRDSSFPAPPAFFLSAVMMTNRHPRSSHRNFSDDKCPSTLSVLGGRGGRYWEETAGPGQLPDLQDLPLSLWRPETPPPQARPWIPCLVAGGQRSKLFLGLLVDKRRGCRAQPGSAGSPLLPPPWNTGQGFNLSARQNLSPAAAAAAGKDSALCSAEFTGNEIGAQTPGLRPDLIQLVPAPRRNRRRRGHRAAIAPCWQWIISPALLRFHSNC